MGFLRTTLVVSAFITASLTSALLAQSSDPFRRGPTAIEPPPADAPAAVRSTPTPRRAQAPQTSQLDKAHRDRLLKLLVRDGKAENLDPMACAILGIRNGGKPVPAMLVAAVEGKVRASFSRLEGKKDDYIFFFDDDKDNPNSPSMAFRADANFRLIGGTEFINGQWTKMPPAKSAALYAQQMRDWADIIDAN